MAEIIDMSSFCRPVNADAKSVRTLKADVVLGVLRKRCRGLGVCKIAARHSLSDKRCSVTSVTIEKRDGEVLRFRFDPAKLCKVQLHLQFFGDLFTVEEAFVLPDFVVTSLQLDHNVVEQGQYKILKGRKYYYVFFPLSV